MIKKILVSVLSIILLSNFLFVNTAFASSVTTSPDSTTTSEVQHLLTIVCTPEMELNEHDVVLLRVYNLSSGKSYSFKLYEYNNFSDKFMMPEGDYIVTELSLQDRTDVILINKTPKFSVNKTTSVIIPITNSGIVTPQTSEPETTTSPPTTAYNPFIPPSETPTNTSSTTSDAANETTTNSNGFSEQHTESQYTENPSQIVTTEENTENEPSDTPSTGDKIILIIIVVALLIAIAIAVIIYKRNKG